MRDIATTTLSGNLTRDVDLRQLPSGADIARLRVASTARRRNGEEWVEKTNYFTIETFGAQARTCAEYLCKGSRVLVDVEPDWREWTDQQGNKREAVTFKSPPGPVRRRPPRTRRQRQRHPTPRRGPTATGRPGAPTDSPHASSSSCRRRRDGRRVL